MDPEDGKVYKAEVWADAKNRTPAAVGYTKGVPRRDGC
jgi:hypothetical protein